MIFQCLFFFHSNILFVALVSKDKEGWVRAGILALVISMVGMIMAFFSGNPALKVIDGQPRTSGRALSQHHVRGLVAVSLAMIATVIAIVIKVKARKTNTTITRNSLILLLVITILTAGALAWTGQAGGRVNHPELQEPADRESGPAHPH